jgi:CheY-like chemotaxis protein
MRAVLRKVKRDPGVGSGRHVNLSCDFVAVKPGGVALAALVNNVTKWIESSHGTQTHSHSMILILSADAVAAALLGALIETLGYPVKFARPPEMTDQTMRRVKPKVCLLDCVEPGACNDEVLGRATMRGISVVIFGTSKALERVRALALEHSIDMLLVPPDPADLEATLKRALKKAG